jgi:hypothetical protein
VTVEFAHDAEAAPVGMRTRMRQMKTRGFNREISFRCASLMRRSLDSYRAYADALTEYWRHRGIQWPS